MKNQAGFFLCGSLQVHFTNLLARKPAFASPLDHLRGKQNCQALFVYRSELGQNLSFFAYNKILQSDRL